MRMYDLIMKKRKKLELSEDEINFIINGYTKGEIPDYQMSAFAMAVVFNSMTTNETAALTRAIAYSGDITDLSSLGDLTVDKHSTGGVGDKTTLIVAPIVAACGLKIAKISGRGLGHTGGTVDKLESIKGYKINLSSTEFLGQVEKIGIAVTGQSGNLTPADKKLYALRDVTATVDSIPLIVSSIMGKKIASGAKTIVLDVKTGSGAFFEDLDSAIELSKEMVNIGNSCQRNTAALITNMDIPLGYAIGNSLEVAEAVDLLKGKKIDDLYEICLSLSAAMLAKSLNITFSEGFKRADRAVKSGKALEKFKEWISVQGGDIGFIDDYSKLPTAKYSRTVQLNESGWICKMETSQIGKAVSVLGAGRIKKEDSIDYSAGIVLSKKTGDKVSPGDVLATIYTNSEKTLDLAEEILNKAVTVGSIKPQRQKLIYKMVGID